MAMKLYNTLSGKEEILSKKPGDTIGIYSCGPTVYHFAHIGNMRAFLFPDILKRTLVFEGYKVKHIMNITDVGHLTDTGDDKIEKEAKKQKKTAQEIAEYYTAEFMKDLVALNIDTKTTKFPKASEHIKEQIEIIKKLEHDGFAYKISDGIYFDTSKAKNYGELARLKPEMLKEGARVEINPEKKNPSDFSLWKFSKSENGRQQEWESPWGTGFPGWHIECSAMSMKYLGNHFEIHTGGGDLIFPHHSNEIAQSESFSGEKFVDIWMHSGTVNIRGQKMAKSDGNIMRLDDIKELGFSPLSYRYLLLGTHYRKPVDWTEEAMSGAQNALEKLNNSFLELPEKIIGHDSNFINEFSSALCDDLNTPLALSIVWKVLGSAIEPSNKRATLLKMDTVLGLGLKGLKTTPIPVDVQELVGLRENARKIKNWDLADEIRLKIEELGYEIKDTEEGYKISKRN